jgi:CheY-specific phosphatase CheX/CheY-like chemotaxis protein
MRSSPAAIKKVILYLGQPSVAIDEARQSLAATLGDKTNPVFIVAKDGPDAELRVLNQKFDAIVVDHKAPRLNEGSFIKNLKSDKNTKCANVLVIVPQENWELHGVLKTADQTIVKPCTLEILVRALAKALATPENMPESKEKKSGFTVDARVVNAIVKASCFVCQQFGIETTHFQKPQVQRCDVGLSGDVAASIEIQSRVFKGMLVLSFQESVYLRMLTNMFGEEQTTINSENQDAIGELSNMILGNAKSDFTQYDVAMSIPKILKKGTPPTIPAGSASILMTGETVHGRFFVEVIAFPISA